jgi:hypothetical protein
MIGLEINVAYAERENVLDWIKAYCKRNKISTTIKQIDFSGWGRDIEEYISLSFKSDNQANCFLRKGNQNYPYFEFY